MKVVINTKLGGFNLSEEAMDILGKLMCVQEIDVHEIDRHNPYLVSVVEKLGADAFGEHSNLKVVEIPDDVDYEIFDFDGIESIVDKKRVWY